MLSVKFHVSPSQLPSSPRRTSGSASISGRPNFAICRMHVWARVRIHAAATRPQGAIESPLYCSPFRAAYSHRPSLSIINQHNVPIWRESFYLPSRDDSYFVVRKQLFHLLIVSVISEVSQFIKWKHDYKWKHDVHRMSLVQCSSTIGKRLILIQKNISWKCNFIFEKLTLSISLLISLLI